MRSISTSIKMHQLLWLRAQVDVARAAEVRSNQEIATLEEEKAALLSDETARKFLALNEKIAHFRLHAARARQEVLVLEPILDYAEASQRREEKQRAVDDRGNMPCRGLAEQAGPQNGSVKGC
jgi:hypothetical protein